MTSHIKSMTEGKPASLIFSFALPLMAGNVFQQLYTVVDTMVVGKAIGVGALAALGAADWLNWMMLGIIQGFTQGFGILMAQEFGAGRYDNLRRSIGNSAILSLLSSLILLGLGQLLARPILTLLQTPPEILPDALLYLRRRADASARHDRRRHDQYRPGSVVRPGLSSGDCRGRRRNPDRTADLQSVLPVPHPQDRHPRI